MSHEKNQNIGDLANILEEKMKELNLVTADEYGVRVTSFNYGSDDAKNFEGCISRGLEEQVLARANKQSYGPTHKIGYGAHSTGEYNHKIIKNTAKNVKTAKRGVCHTFAQLAADHLLTQMLEKKIPPVSIKMVSHNNSMGSHTFLLLNHKSKDLTDLSKCIIVDPWAVVMGHWESYGVFNQVQYPFEMLDNLEVVYDSSKDKEYQKLLIEKGIKEKPKPKTRSNSYPKMSKPKQDTKLIQTTESLQSIKPLPNTKPFFAQESAQKIKQHLASSNLELDKSFEKKKEALMKPYKDYYTHKIVNDSYADYKKDNDTLYNDYCKKEKKDIEQNYEKNRSKILKKIVKSAAYLIVAPFVGAFQETYNQLKFRYIWLKSNENEKDENLNKLIPDNKITWLKDQNKYQDENTWKKNMFNATEAGKNILAEINKLDKTISNAKSHNNHIFQISTLEGPARDEYIKKNKCENLAQIIKSASSSDTVNNYMKKDIGENKIDTQVASATSHLAFAH